MLPPRVTTAWQQRAVGRLQRRLQTAAVDRSPVHEQGHPAATGTGYFGARDRPVDGDPGGLDRSQRDERSGERVAVSLGERQQEVVRP